MRKIINSTYMTLDGDCQNVADWHFPYLGEQAIQAAGALLQSSDALIMGRKTYDNFSRTWPPRQGDPFADRINSMPKHVVSTTLTDPSWTNTHVISGDVAAEVRKLKEQPGKNIVQYGFGPVTRLLLNAGLLDELRIWLHPVLFGKAKPGDLLYRDDIETKLDLVGIESHKTGIVILSYAPVKPA